MAEPLFGTAPPILLVRGPISRARMVSDSGGRRAARSPGHRGVPRLRRGPARRHHRPARPGRARQWNGVRNPDARSFVFPRWSARGPSGHRGRRNGNCAGAGSRVETRAAGRAGQRSGNRGLPWRHHVLDLLPGSSDVEVRCDAGRTTLTGTVSQKGLKRDIGEIAWATPWAKDVQNNITIAPRRRSRAQNRDSEASAVAGRKPAVQSYGLHGQHGSGL